jgi:ABC-type polysaccharide/polyol phosphate transport system ATPase subunit
MEDIVRFNNVSKCFSLHRPRSLRGFLSNLVSRHASEQPKREEIFWALKDATFRAEEGQVIGLIGRNGAGKSTLLKIIAGILSPTTGTAKVTGRIAPMLELGAGFHPSLTGRENIYLNGSLLGLSRKEIDRLMDDIIAYASIGQFVDLPINQYSSGMRARLGFAVATQIPSSILLVDEVMAVGDISFRNKCLETMQKFAQEGKLIFFVSHEMQLIRRMCTRALLLDKGNLIASGTPKEVVDVYHALIAEDSAARARQATGEPPSAAKDVSDIVTAERHGSGEAQVLAAEILGDDRTPKHLLNSGEPSRINVRVRFDADINHLLIGIIIRDQQGVDVYMTNSVWQNIELGPKGAGEVWDFSFDQEMWLAPGTYTVSVAVSQFFGEDRVKRLDWVADVIQFSIFSEHKMGGYANLHSKITAPQIIQPRCKTDQPKSQNEGDSHCPPNA